jgi:hypothetical protein
LCHYGDLLLDVLNLILGLLKINHFDGDSFARLSVVPAEHLAKGALANALDAFVIHGFAPSGLPNEFRHRVTPL